MLHSSKTDLTPPLQETASPTFKSLGLRPQLLASIPQSWLTPLPIQAEVIPLALKGRDIIGLAETGSGKTGAFAIPIINDLIGKHSSAVRALVLNPVRELAAQTHEVFQKLSRNTGVSCGLCRGGVDKSSDIYSLRRERPAIVIGTLGRLAHLTRLGELDLSRVETLVIDEADRMAKDFFTAEFEQILSGIPESRQTLLFSATMPRDILYRVKEITRAPVTVDLGANKPPVSIQFEEYDVDSHREKLPLFTSLMKERNFERGIVFMNRKVEIDAVENLMRNMGIDAWAVHHDRSQLYCENTLAQFKEGKIKFLIASDALQRGIDVTGLPLVVNYDFPGSYDEFTHRAGRTGRQGNPGLVISFLTYINRRNLAGDSGQYHDFQRNLDANCNIERKPQPRITTTLSAYEIAALDTAYERTWKIKRGAN